MAAQLLKEKSREISYALIRVSYYIKREDLRNQIDSLAFRLLHDVAVAEVDSHKINVNKAIAAISALDGLIRLAHSIYEVEPVNATILVRELDNLNSAMRQCGNAATSEELPNLETFFTKQIIGKKINENSDNSGKDLPVDSDISINKPAVSANINNLSVKIRQSAIINKLKSQSGNGCRLKDLIAELPDVSERTLRYDLQRLCDQGIIERVGNGGPSSYYQVFGNKSVMDGSLAERMGVGR